MFPFVSQIAHEQLHFNGELKLEVHCQAQCFFLIRATLTPSVCRALCTSETTVLPLELVVNGFVNISDTFVNG